MEHAQDRIRAALEATALGAGVDRDTVEALCALAAEHGLAGVCIPPEHVTRARRRLVELCGDGRRPAVVTVAGFPAADAPAGAIAEQVTRAVSDGAEEVDVVLPLRWSREGAAGLMTAYARRMCSAAGPAPVKMILETAALEAGQRERAARAVVRGGVRWVKTSTGVHPAGGATEAAVRRLRAAVPPDVGVKASGGIRSREAAVRMLEAGADRIGASAVGALLGRTASDPSGGC